MHFGGLAALLLFIGAVFALREVISHGWLGPAPRFFGGIALGAGAWLVAELLRWRRYDAPGKALAGAGSGILYATLWAGNARWGLLGQGSTFASMIAVTVVGMLLAERRNSRFAAWLALLGGYATPILLSTGENRPVAFFGYLALTNAGILYAAHRRRWPDVVAGAGLGTLVLYVGWAAQWRAPDQVPVGLAAAAVHATLLLFAAKRRGEGLATKLASGAAVASALLLWLVATAVLGTPADPQRLDPMSSLPLAWDQGSAPWFVAAWMAIGALGLPLALRGSRLGRVLAGSVVALGLAIVAVAWVAAGTPRWEVVAGLVPAVALCAALAGGMEAAVPVFALGGLAAGGMALAVPVPAASLPWLGVGLAFAAVLAWARSGSRWPLVAAAAVVGLPVSVGVADRLLEGEALAVTAAVIPAYLLLAVTPTLWPKKGDLAGALSAFLAPLALSVGLWSLWRHALGTEIDGALPLLLAANLVVAALVQVRVARAAPTSLPVVVLVLGALTGIAAAVPLQLSNGWITVGWAVLVMLLGLTNRRLPHPLFVAFATVLALAVGGRLLLNPYALEYGRGDGLYVLNWTLYTWGLPTVCLLVAAAAFPQKWLARGLRTLAILTGFALLNFEIAHAFAVDGELSFHSERLAQEMVRSVSWGGYGLFLVLLGIVRKSRAVRMGGLGFMLLAAGKVLLVDLWILEGFLRVGALFGLAIVGLATAMAFAFVERSVSRREAPPSPSEPTP